MNRVNCFIEIFCIHEERADKSVGDKYEETENCTWFIALNRKESVREMMLHNVSVSSELPYEEFTLNSSRYKKHRDNLMVICPHKTEALSRETEAPSDTIRTTEELRAEDSWSQEL